VTALTRLGPVSMPCASRVARIDSSHSREMLAPILKNIHETIPNLARSREGSCVEAVGPHFAPSPQHAIHRLGKAYPEALETARERAPVFRFHHQVQVVGLDRELENPEPASRRPRESAAQGKNGPLFPKRGQQAARRETSRGQDTAARATAVLGAERRPCVQTVSGRRGGGARPRCESGFPAALTLPLE